MVTNLKSGRAVALSLKISLFMSTRKTRVAVICRHSRNDTVNSPRGVEFGQGSRVIKEFSQTFANGAGRCNRCWMGAISLE